MLERISELEGAAELLPPGREASIVRSKLQEARLAELERLRGTTGVDAREALDVVDAALARGRRGAVHEMTGS